MWTASVSEIVSYIINVMEDKALMTVYQSITTYNIRRDKERAYKLPARYRHTTSCVRYSRHCACWIMNSFRLGIECTLVANGVESKAGCNVVDVTHRRLCSTCTCVLQQTEC